MLHNTPATQGIYPETPYSLRHALRISPPKKCYSRAYVHPFSELYSILKDQTQLTLGTFALSLSWLIDTLNYKKNTTTISH